MNSSDIEYKEISLELKSFGRNVSMDDIQKIAERIRRLRQYHNLTQQELADRCGFSNGMISKIENARISIPIATLSKIAKSLDVKLSWFFEEEGDDPALTIVRNDQRRPLVSRGNQFGYFYQGLSNRKKFMKIHTFMVTVPKQVEGKKPFVHEEEEFMLVIEGAIQLFYDGELHPMETGDSAYYLGDRPHMFLPKNNREAKVLVIFAG
jgi:transcriptional regulator with XRE-family HTH domain